MVAEFEPKHVVPNPKILSTFGVLNIVIASCLLICGMCGTGYFAVVIPLLDKTLGQSLKKIQADQEAKNQAAIKALDEQEKAATSDEEKAEIVARRKEIENRPKMQTLPVDAGVKSLGLDRLNVQIYFWVDFLSGLFLNLLMLASGIGLVMLRRWGLRLALGVAVVKIVRLAICYGYFAFEIVPSISVGMAKVALEAMQRSPAGMPVHPNMYGDLVRIYSIAGGVGAAGMVLFGAIYPGVAIWFLTRQNARAACVPSTATDSDGGHA